MRQTRATMRALAVLTGTASLAVPAYAQSAQLDQSAVDTWITVWLILIAVVLTLYFIPSIVAFRRRHPNRWAILVVNVVFGASGLGWLGSLIWACNVVHLSPTGNNGGESGLNLFVNDAAVGTRNTPSVLTPTEAIPSARLDQLKRLHEQGAISDEEYASMRKSVLYASVGLDQGTGS